MISTTLHCLLKQNLSYLSQIVFSTVNPKGIKLMTQLRIGLSQLLERNYKHGLHNSFSLFCSFPAGIYLLKVNNEGTRTTPGFVLVPLLLTLNIFHTLF